uniref:hypothetical protein n=1 Tax=Novacetimonas pomaceti TaxID=2021998 RepID=UPI001C2CD641|nr:hypothetical protein [Novacetimonas pomaceti]MBV1833045.1 hypothetical protein [Novacetimonas pomaceti]
MWSSDETEHIPDERQVDLEEAIKMTNETTFYLVPDRLTDEQCDAVGLVSPSGWDTLISEHGTPIPPCADVETVQNTFEQGWAPHSAVRAIPLVRRTDMEAQVARVAAEKNAVIARLRAALTAIALREIGDSPAPTQAHIEQLEWDIEWCQRKARAALNEGEAE